jgi:ABC-2 type transport system ATP-binding protein
MSEDNKNIALSVQSVSKTFKLPHERHSGLKSAMVSLVGGKHKRGFEQQRVLDDVSFEVKKGEFFGIVGRNGSGKSTLLKLMSGIYTPDSGKIHLSGSLTPFIELGVGFNPELTGLENVYLNGALLGFSRKEMKAKYDDIVGFAELEDFMDQKLKNYSSGMQVRLAFAIAIQSDSDVLILDEVLAVGDEAFQRKCNDYFTSVKKDPTKTVILVTHGMDNVKKYCDRAMMIQDGKIVSIGDPNDVASDYSLENLTQRKKNTSTKSEGVATVHKSELVQKFKVSLLSPEVVDQTSTVRVKVSLTTKDIMKVQIAIGVNDIDRKIRIFTKKSEYIETNTADITSWTAEFNFSQLQDSSLKIMGAVYDAEDNILAYNEERGMPRFQIRRSDYGTVEKSTALLIGDGLK